MGRRGLFSVLASNFFKNISITSWLILINVFFFIISLFLGRFFDYLVLQPKLLFENYYIWTLITSMFMHAGFAHLLFNMFSLYFIGNFLEKIIGRKRFIYFYLISGILAGLFFSVLAYSFGYGFWTKIFGGPSVLAVGASGAIFGLLGLLAVLTPKSKVYLLAGPLIAIILQAILDSFVTNNSILTIVNLILGIYIFVAIFSIFSFSRKTIKIALPLELKFWLLPIIAIVPLILIGLVVPLPIGNMAHLGGLLTGLIYGFYLRKRYKKKVALLGKYFK